MDALQVETYILCIHNIDFFFSLYNHSLQKIFADFRTFLLQI